ncbi:hypothetical protein OE88DRAFT_66631 [Heliocybe sulcata]|uniref:F-box domain-containing protein n=1 Tax=Heliocybe sulcata TaxID=5364 RepID=A0A5C3NL57_9AGAM|nr:hypothetical protein OE88DRAFT_66631 [Heliocybe sulcata]
MRRQDPISRLNADLAAEVFLHWVAVDKDAPWMASMVSRLWRKSILSCPQAWSIIRVDFEDKPLSEPPIQLLDDLEWCIEEDTEPDLETTYEPRGRPRPLALWLERAGSCPLFLSLILGRTYPAVPYMCRVWDKLLSAIGRAQEIELGAESRMVVDVILELLSDPAPGLRRLSVKCGVSFLRKADPWLDCEKSSLKSLLQAVAAAPALYALTLQDCLPSTYDRTAFSRLRELTLMDVRCTPGGLVSLLADFRDLEVLDINSSCLLVGDALSSSSQEFEPSRSIRLRKLKTLKLTSFHTHALAFLLRSLHAPLLRALEIRCDGPIIFSVRSTKDVEAGDEETKRNKTSEDERMHTFLDEMVTLGNALVDLVNTTPYLSSLTLQYVYIKDPALAACLHPLPNLQSLTLVGIFISDRTFRALSQQSSRGKVSICQQLKHLELERCPFVTGRMLARLVNARHGGYRLTRLNIIRCEKILEKDITAAWICDYSASMKIYYVPFEAHLDDTSDEDDEDDEEYDATLEKTFVDEYNHRGRSDEPKEVKIKHVYREKDVHRAAKKMGPNTVVIHDMSFPHAPL